ncbi:MAG: HesA/MoeB/ThiF family protein [Firmicutes bacterium]|nr:HesA/MoeB/ThiF family protein [Bacillota bacterium]
MKRRYERNIGTITEMEQQLLAGKSVCVVGCGGLGGGVIEGLVRMGVGRLTVIDGDVFDETNLNRQVLSNQDNLGHAKAVEARLQMKVINSDVQVDSIQALLDSDNARGLIYGHDAVVDALDNIEARLELEFACEEEKLPLIHGAIGGWNGQVAVVMPGMRLLHDIYDVEEAEEGEPEKPTNPAFTPAVVSAIQVVETVKVLLGREETLAGRLLTIDLLNQEYEIIEF